MEAVFPMREKTAASSVCVYQLSILFFFHSPCEVKRKKILRSSLQVHQALDYVQPRLIGVFFTVFFYLFIWWKDKCVYVCVLKEGRSIGFDVT